MLPQFEKRWEEMQKNCLFVFNRDGINLDDFLNICDGVIVSDYQQMNEILNSPYPN